MEKVNLGTPPPTDSPGFFDWVKRGLKAIEAASQKRSLILDHVTGITDFVRTLLDDEDAAAILTTLGVSTFIQTMLDDDDAAAARATLALSGAVIGSSIDTYLTNTSITTVIPLDDTIPQNTEGTEILSISYSPKSTTSKLRARFKGVGANTANAYVVAAMFNGAADAIDACHLASPAGNNPVLLSLEAEWSPATTSDVTVSVRVGPGATGTIRMNGSGLGRAFGGVEACVLVVEEIQG